MTAVATPLSRDETPEPAHGVACNYCGAEIASPRPGQKFCSHEHRIASWEARHRPAEFRRRLACGRAPEPQPGLFDERDRIETAFERFHRAHPEVYALLVRLAREAKRRGRSKIGIGALYEVARWEFDLGAEDGFKLNNNFRALYARLIQEREEDLDGFFETRKRRAA